MPIIHRLYPVYRGSGMMGEPFALVKVAVCLWNATPKGRGGQKGVLWARVLNINSFDVSGTGSSVCELKIRGSGFQPWSGSRGRTPSVPGYPWAQYQTVIVDMSGINVTFCISLKWTKIGELKWLRKHRPRMTFRNKCSVLLKEKREKKKPDFALRWAAV